MDAGRQDKDLEELADRWRRLEEVARVKASCSGEQTNQKRKDEAARDAIEAQLRHSIIASRRP
jgi:hypothetical protein